VSQQETSRVAQELLTRLRAGASPNEIAMLCSPHLDWNIPGDTGVLPWIGRKTGRSAISDFIRDTRSSSSRFASRSMRFSRTIAGR
jgi:uncharacterized protein